ncbi:hypothetical protein SI65_06971 [Aspergillus cristatus]|uniref:Uncharacterized protein n=1 Tax=Aspergillus cristatus TaxID=573508 RepID=A0A1E3BA62_ASPCR|nr:hypothetical protein SI65_06971 [Aspergillus cristatus]
MRTASQLDRLEAGLCEYPKHRFTVTETALKSDWIRIHLITIGGKTYIHNLTDQVDGLPHVSTSSSWNDLESIYMPLLLAYRRAFVTLGSLLGYRRTRPVLSIDHRLKGCKYLAVKSDELGIIDIAFSETKGEPNWILNNHTVSTSYISKIRYANIQNLIMVSDSWKCRAIVPSKRHGAEPYFHEAPYPSNSDWVDARFRMKSRLHDGDFTDPAAYFVKAKYIPFAGMTQISFTVHASRLGIEGDLVGKIYQQYSYIYRGCCAWA